MTTPAHAAFRGRLPGALPRTRRDHGPARSRGTRCGAVTPKARYRPGPDLPGVRDEPCALDFEDDFQDDPEDAPEVER